MGVFSADELSELNLDALLAAWRIAHDGRQYDDIEEDKRLIGDEMAARLENLEETMENVTEDDN